MSNVRVVCRIRPLNSKEKDRGGYDILEYTNEFETVIINRPKEDKDERSNKQAKHSFNFDKCFPPGTSQADVYDVVAAPILEDVFKGYNGTLFVYGQTGSGKTHTMMGPDGGKGMEDQAMQGIVPRMAMNVFYAVEEADEDLEFIVKVSFLEIYMERIRDLLDPSKANLKVREDKVKGIWVEGATEVYCSCDDDVMNVLRLGQVHRSVASTKMNAESSRSHSIFIVNITQKNIKTGSTKSGKLFLVDLAGSEKVEKTGATGQTLEEAKMINKSLTALGQVINALTDEKAKHIPYRDSKLTRLLQNSLGGNSRTTLCINASPSDYNYGETMSTLRFGQRAKSIKNKAKVNQERSATELMGMLARSEKEINLLKAYIDMLVKDLLELSPGHAVPPMSVVAGVKPTPSSLDDEGSSSSTGGRKSRRQEEIEVDDVIHEDEEEMEEESLLRRSAAPEFEEIMGVPTNSMSEEQEAELRAELKQQMAALKMVVDEYSSLNDELTASQTTALEFEVQKKVLTSQVAELELEKESHDYYILQWQLTIEEMTSQMEHYKEKVKEMEERVEVRDAQIKEHDKEIKRAEEATADGVAGKGNGMEGEEGRDKQSSAEAAAIVELEDAIASLRKENDSLFAQKAELEKAVSVVQFTTIADEIEEDEAALQSFDASMDLQVAVTKYQTLETQHKKLRELTFKTFKEFDSLKTSLLHDLQNRCEKVIDLKVLLEEAREQTNKVLARSGSKAKTEKKVAFLDQELEQLTRMYQKETDENYRLEATCDSSKKKIEQRDKLVLSLEEKMTQQQKDGQSQIQELQNKVKEIKAAIEVVEKNNASAEQSATLAVSNPHHARIAKPLRGGGGGKKAEERRGFFGGFFGGAKAGEENSGAGSAGKSPT